MRKTCLTLSLILLIPMLIGAQEDDYLHFTFGLNHVLKYQRRGDYPSVPAHSPVCFGMGYTTEFSGRFSFDLQAWYTQRHDVTLKRPGVQDDVEYRTADHVSLTFNVLFHILNDPVFIPYLTAGIGLDYVVTDDEVYLSEQGNEVPFITYRLDPMFNLGVGLKLVLNEDFGLIIDARYSHIWDAKQNNVLSYVIRGGVIIIL